MASAGWRDGRVCGVTQSTGTSSLKAVASPLGSRSNHGPPGESPVSARGPDVWRIDGSIAACSGGPMSGLKSNPVGVKNRNGSAGGLREALRNLLAVEPVAQDRFDQ